MHSAPVCRLTTKKGTAKQGKGLLKVISMNVVETQNEVMQRVEENTLVKKRKSKEIDGVTNCKGKNSRLTEGSR